MQESPEKEQVVKVVIFGEEYPIRGYADRESILRVADYVDKKMREIALRSKNRSPNKVAILTALNLADELLYLKDQSENEQTEIEDRAKNLMDILDSSLSSSDNSQ